MKVFRIVLVSVIALFLIAAVTAAILFVRTDPGRVLRLLSDQVRDSLALEIRASRARLDILRGIHLDDVEVLDVSTPGRTNRIATFRSGAILYNPFAILLGRIDILGVTASGIRMTLDDLTRTVDSVTRRVSAAVTNAKSSQGPLSLVIRSLAVEESELVIGRVPFRVTGRVLFAQLFDDSAIRAELALDGGTVAIRGSLRNAEVGIRDFDLARAVGLNEKLVLNAVDGRVIRETDSLYGLKVEKADLTYLRWRGQTGRPAAGSYNVRTGVLRFSDFVINSGESIFQAADFQTGTVRPFTKIVVSNMDAAVSDFLDGASGRAKGGLLLSVTEPSNVTLSGAVEADGLSFGFLKDLYGKFLLENNRLQGSVSGRAAGGELTADLRCEDILGRGVSVNAKIDTVRVEEFLESLKPSPAASRATGGDQMAIPVQIQLAAGRILYGKLQTGRGDFRALIRPAGGGLTLQDAQVEVFRGRLSARGEFDGTNFNGEASLTDAKLREFTAQFLDSGRKLFGNAAAKARFSVNTLQPLRSSGAAELTLKNGEIKDVFLQDQISAVLFDIPLDDVFFDTVRCEVSMADGTVNLDSFLFESDHIRAAADGNIRLTNRNMTLRSELSFSKDYLSGLPNVAQIFTAGYEDASPDAAGQRIRFRVLVDGPLPKPDVRLEKKR